MMARQAMSKRLRFEVFKRDSFRCQYCGRSAPDVVLHVDHLHPVASGGENDILNLVTACADCNGGKGARLLGDTSVVDKQRQQLKELNKKREQLEMMIAWRDGLRSIDGETLAIVVARRNATTPGWHLNEIGEASFKKWLKKFPLELVLSAIDECSDHIVIGSDGRATKESVDATMESLGSRIFIEAARRKDPDGARLYYIRGILRRTCSRYLPERQAMELMREALAAGVAVSDIELAAKHCTSWTDFGHQVDRLISDPGAR